MSNTLFTEYKPSTVLSPYIQSYWHGSFNVDGEANISQSVLPNGCIELIIHTSSDHCSLTRPGADWSKSPEFTLLGLYDKPYEVQFSRPVTVFGIRFFPDGLRNVFGVAPAEFLGTYEDSNDVLGNSMRDFCEQVRDAGSPSGRVELANSFILSQVETHRIDWDYTHLAMQLIRKCQGTAEYQSLIDQVPISVRQLQREFKALYGITVVDYMRISRMNAIHNYMLSKNRSLTELSHDLQFTDQSHFNREFKNFVGVAPTKFARNRESFIMNIAQ
ncbi:MAG: helix-turn-helix transcriptional regulator [Imperialibacter sp.]|uniref:helix-turn-helix transcriptional regulator n=1 Tax=Imperialibacter sp. TaxID=2038411 RepID=UPI0032EE1534